MSTDISAESSSGKWKLGLLAIGTIIVLGSVAAIISGATASSDKGPRLTHKITRGDLIVTVIEQGTLESSDNTEIKCQVRGFSMVTWAVKGGTIVKPGDELVRLDTKIIEETVSLQKTNFHNAKATLAQSKAEVAVSEINIKAYLDGRFRSQTKMFQKQVIIAESNLATAEKMLKQSELLFKRGYVTELEVAGNAFSVKRAKLELKVSKTEIDVLNRFTKAMEMETMKGNLIASKSKRQADEAGLAMTERRRDRALKELAACVVKADRSGLVIYPSAAKWKNVPDIAEGISVRKDQVLLLMPDLTKMQIKVGIHESIIDRIKPGLVARVTLPDRTLMAKVSTVATVTRPAGWWTGNVVKYDTIIKLPSEAGLKPGMSAEVEVVMAEHKDVVMVPVAAVVETDGTHACWVKTAEGVARRPLKLGDSNDVFIEVKAGLKEGDEVVLNPTVYVDDAPKETTGKGN